MSDPTPPVPAPDSPAALTPAMAAPVGPRPPHRGGVIVLIAVMAVVLLGIIVAIPVTVAAVSAPPQSHQTAAPKPAPTAKNETTNSCWDGSSNVKGCPQLTGLAGLRWIFVDQNGSTPATCSKDTRDFKPRGAIEVYACYWDDLPNTVAYVSRYDDVESSQQDWTDYMDATYGAKPGRMDLDDEDSGIYIEGTTTDGTNVTSQEDVYGYDLIPYYLDVYTDMSAGGTVAQQTSVLGGRIALRSLTEINAALDTVK